MAYRVLTTAGAIYMSPGGTIIWKFFRHGSVRIGLTQTTGVPDSSPWRGWLIGAGTNLPNPKDGVFYIATVPQFLPRRPTGAPASDLNTAPWPSSPGWGTHPRRRSG